MHSRLTRGWVLILGTLLAGATWGTVLSAPPPARGPAAGPTRDPLAKVEPQVLAATATGQTTSFLVLLTAQSDLTAAYQITNPAARGWYVYQTLQRQAALTQADLRAFLTAQGRPYQAFWIANALVVTGDRALVTALARRPDVRALESNASAHRLADPLLPSSSEPLAHPATVEWGVQQVNAPAVWALGATGQGLVIGVADTGMQWDHPALLPHYRGWTGLGVDHNYNWHDAVHASPGNPCGTNAPQPCDDQGHGTHTTGTAVGDDGAGNQIGVAPGARWIGCRNMDQGYGTPAQYAECFQFFLAPTDLAGNNPDPARRPDIINNSWGCTSGEGCAPNTLETIVNNTQAAGIFVVAAAGNTGPGCGTVDTPPALYPAAFTAGATDSGNVLAPFSSRGPAAYTTPPLLKPNLVAPGVNVRSSWRGATYATVSGTSMAAPHVAGVVALLWSARPALARAITATKTLLQQTANPGVGVSPPQVCGNLPSSQIPNNSFGYGLIDALAAVNASAPGTPPPSVTGTPPTASPTPCVPAPWTARAPLPTALQGVALATDGQAAYAAGGYDGAHVLAQFARYDPLSNRWSLLAPLPTPADGTAAVYAPNVNRVYVFGGADDAGHSLTVTRVYDVARGTWATAAPLPAPRNRFAGVGYANGAIYLVGGRSALSRLTAQPQTWRYDPLADTWTTLAPLPLGLGGAGSGVIGGHLYVVSGADANDTLSLAVYDYDLAANTWTVVGTVPQPVHDGGSAVLGGRLWLFGGDSGAAGPTAAGRAAPQTATNVTQIWDPGSRTWLIGPALPDSRSDLGGTALGATGLAGGGISPAGVEAAVDGAPDPCVGGGPPPTPPGGPTNTTTPCPLPFTDVHPSDYFAAPVQYLACRGIVSGYADGTFRPYASTTRAQMVKIVVLGFGLPIQTPAMGAYTFHDVAPGAPFFAVIETAAGQNIVSGYTCGPGGPGPCDPQNRPYFRPNTTITRGQLSKIAVVGAGWPLLNPPRATFTDVPSASPFYAYVETAVCHGVVSGYADDTFHPGASATRGQIAKIVYLSVTTAPGACPAGARR
jgi:serine protease AprX